MAILPLSQFCSLDSNSQPSNNSICFCCATLEPIKQLLILHKHIPSQNLSNQVELPALHVQDPSTGEHVAPFLQVQAEEQFTPYIPAGQRLEQSAP